VAVAARCEGWSIIVFLVWLFGGWLVQVQRGWSRPMTWFPQLV